MTDIYWGIRKLINEHYLPQDYPALYNQMNEWQENKPLKGLSILDATPVFRNTMTKYLALIAAGAKLSVGISDVMPYDSKIVEFLRELGVNIVTPCSKDKFDIILDCAGSFSEIDASIGYVELTRSGVEKYSRCVKPIFVADSGNIKKIETMLGTGESLFRALLGLGYDTWKNKNIVVFGSGKVGSGIIMYGYTNGGNITVVTNPKTVFEKIALKCKSVIDYTNVDAVCKAVKDADLIVMATGNKNAIPYPNVINTIINSKALLANMGVEDEFGQTVPTLRVLNNKKPLNFILEEPTHLKYIEATMALHNAGALYMVSNICKGGIINPPPQMELQILEITRDNGIIASELELLML